MLGGSFLAAAGASALGLFESHSSAQTQQQSVLPSTAASTNSSASTASSVGSSVPSGYLFLAPLTAVQGKSYAYFTHPAYGSSILVDSGGQWRAFSATCTHAGCAVQPSGQSLYCPCHAGYFSSVDGSVQGGPPSSSLAEFGVIVQSGSIYVSKSRIN